MVAREVSKVIVICPKCAIKLKVDEAKLSPAGSKFKCPKCAAVLVVRKPAAQQKKTLNSSTVLVAHSNPDLMQQISAVLISGGYRVITASDGIDLMVKALKEFPFIAIIEVALPKIYGFEVCRRVKARAETKDMKFILIPAIHDKTKYRREPTSLYGADDYIEEFDIPAQLLEKIRLLKGDVTPAAPSGDKEKSEAVPRPAAGPSASEVTSPEQSSAISAGMKTAMTGMSVQPPAADEKIEKARRLARTIINDIHLYNVAKVEAAIKAGDFYAVFASEVKEGKKLYDNRIPQDVRDVFDYYREAIENFIAARKGALK
ncbi:MAG: hypothetical protein C0402_01380 [Thermodesulfovibrio sp.]|nr:hypothetical protein [Thermodesulfovibrio sp.]